MAHFEYTGITPGGSEITGRLQAADRDRAAQELAELRIDVRELREAAPPSRRASGLGAEDLIFLNTQLASLAESGMALDAGLAQLARDIESPRLRRWLEELVSDIQRGRPLDQAISARESDLPVLYSSVVRAGMESGHLPAVLLNLNQHLRLIGNTRRLLWEVATYPLIVAGLALLVLSFFFLGLMPGFKQIFADFDTRLPPLTMFIIMIADNFLAVVVGTGITGLTLLALWHLLRLTAGGRSWRERFACALPVIGEVYRASLVARFLRSVATATAAGLTLPRSLRLSAQATGSTVLTRDAEHLAGEVERGQSIYAANQATRFIPALFGFCVQSSTGQDALPLAIGRLAGSYENRAWHVQSRLRTILFPLFIIVLGMLLGLGIFGVFLPLVALVNSISGG